VERTRTITKRDMVRNSALPAIEVDPETFAVTADGVLATVPPADSVRVNRMYFFS
jgi:urease subunit alpha